MKNMICECKNYVKMAVLVQVLLCFLTASALGASAQEMPASIAAASAAPATEYVQVYIDGTPYSGRAVLYEDTTYVDLITFAEQMCACTSAWDPAATAVTVSGDGITMRAALGDTYVEANERYLWCPKGLFSDGNAFFVPIRVAAKALGGEVSWNAEEFAAYITSTASPIEPGATYYDETDLYWLSRIIYAESGAEPFRGQIAVGNVVLNRVRADDFPDTIYNVIFDRQYGVQFTPTANGRIYCEPSEESVIAAKICLDGYTISEEIMYFLNPTLASNFWVPQNRDFVMTISGHDFYS